MSENTEKTEFGMLFSFPDQSENFVHGFEAGMIWQEMADAEKFEIDRGFDAGLPIHTTNIELVQRMANARGYHLETKDTGLPEWTAIKLTWFGEALARPALSLVIP